MTNKENKKEHLPMQIGDLKALAELVKRVNAEREASKK